MAVDGPDLYSELGPNQRRCIPDRMAQATLPHGTRFK